VFASGINDILIGDSCVILNGTVGAGSAYVIYGSSFTPGSNLKMVDAASAVYSKYSNIQEGDQVGAQVNFVGDVNGDGAVDFLVLSAGTGGNTGIAYLVYGIPSPTPSLSPTMSMSMSISLTPAKSAIQARTSSKKPTKRPSPSIQRRTQKPTKSEPSSALSLLSHQATLWWTIGCAVIVCATL